MWFGVLLQAVARQEEGSCFRAGEDSSMPEKTKSMHRKQAVSHLSLSRYQGGGLMPALGLQRGDGCMRSGEHSSVGLEKSCCAAAGMLTVAAYQGRS